MKEMVMMVLVIVSVVLTGCVRSSEGQSGVVKRAIEPKNLLAACASVNYGSTNVGSGFFVEVYGREIKTWLVTTREVQKEVVAQSEASGLPVKVLMKSRKYSGANSAVREELDFKSPAIKTVSDNLVAMPISGAILVEPDIDLVKLVYRGKNSEEVYMPGRLAIDSEIEEGEIKTGAKVFMLAADRGGVNLYSDYYFPIFYRQGVVAHVKSPLVIDCRSGPDSRGAPVFLVTESGPKLLGVVKRQVPYMEDKVVDESRREEKTKNTVNTGLTVVEPVDSLVRWLAEESGK